MADKTKLLNLAQKHLTKGNLDKAIKAFQDLVALDPRDYRLSLRLADLLARAGRKKEAIEQYEKVAKVYVKDDFTPRAIAVYKTILRLDPELLSTYEKLSELYKSQGLEAEALSNLENLFSLYEKKKDENKQIEVLRIMVGMDPENLGFQVRLGETLARKGRKQEAAEAFAKAASTLSRRGFHDRASALFEKITSLDPDNVAVRRELCAHYLESGQYPQAKREVEAILAADPDDPRMTLLLGRIHFQIGDKVQGEAKVARSISLFSATGELDNVLREYLFVAQTHQRNGELDEAEAFYANIHKAAPRETKALRGLVAVAEAREDREAQVGHLLELSRVLLDEGELRSAEGALDRLLEVDPGNAAAAALLEQLSEGGAPSPGREAPSPEGEVPSEPMETLEEIEQVEELGEELLVEEGQLLDVSEVPEKDLEETASLEELAMEAGAAEPELEDSIPEIELEDFEQEIAASVPGLMEMPGEDAGEALEEVEPSEPSEAVSEELSLEDILVEIDVYQRYGLTDKVQELLADARARFGNDPVLLEKEALLTRTEVPPEPPIMAFEEPSPAELDTQTVPIAPPTGPEEAPEFTKKVVGDPFAEDMEEAEFYLSQGLEDEAVRIYNSILRRSPGYRNASLALDRIQGGTSAVAAEEAPPAPVETGVFDPAVAEVRSKLIVEDSVDTDVGGFLDLADEIRTELAEEMAEPAVPEAKEEGPVTFEEIFAEFKKGIAETLGEQEYETHYNLGIAYKDMGLHDDAIREFEISSRDPKLLQDSLSLMAMCFLEKHDYASSVKALHKALEGAKEQGRTGLLFQLGEVYARTKDWGQALEYYQQVRDRDPSFDRINEVMEKTRQLMAASGKGKVVKPAAEADMDDMLADLIREVEEMAQESSGKEPEPGGGKSKKDRISYL